MPHSSSIFASDPEALWGLVSLRGHLSAWCFLKLSALRVIHSNKHCDIIRYFVSKECERVRCFWAVKWGWRFVSITFIQSALWENNIWSKLTQISKNKASGCRSKYHHLLHWWIFGFLIIRMLISGLWVAHANCPHIVFVAVWAQSVWGFIAHSHWSTPVSDQPVKLTFRVF